MPIQNVLFCEYVGLNCITNKPTISSKMSDIVQIYVYNDIIHFVACMYYLSLLNAIQVVFCDVTEDLAEYIELSQLPNDIGGNIVFDCKDWIENRSVSLKHAPIFRYL